MSAFKDGLFAGRSVFVAGGTSGINLGIAQRFAALGAKVGVVGRNPEKAANAAASIGNGAIGLSTWLCPALPAIFWRPRSACRPMRSGRSSISTSTARSTCFVALTTCSTSRGRR